MEIRSLLHASVVLTQGKKHQVRWDLSLEMMVKIKNPTPIKTVARFSILYRVTSLIEVSQFILNW
jgi:hypothetical protein